MSGNKAGGKKASATIKNRYGENFYRINGAKGGTISRKKPGNTVESLVQSGVPVEFAQHGLKPRGKQ